MNAQGLVELFDDIIKQATEAKELAKAGLMVRVRDGWNGHPRSPSFDAGQSTHRPPEDLPDELRGDLDYSDPVGRSVAQSNALDRAAADARRLMKEARAARTALGSFHSIAARYKPRPATSFDSQQTQEPEPGCDSCARVPGPASVSRARREQVPWFNPVHTEVTLSDGKIWSLCRWCWETPIIGARATNDVPPKEDVESYRDTGRARRRSA